MAINIVDLLDRMPLETQGSETLERAPDLKPAQRLNSPHEPVFLTSEDVSKIKFRYNQQSLGSTWYGFSLVGKAPSRVLALIAFTAFGGQGHVTIRRLSDGTYALMSDDETVLATADRFGMLLDLFDDNTRPH